MVLLLNTFEIMKRLISPQEMQALIHLSAEIGVDELIKVCAAIIQSTEQNEEFSNHLVCKLILLSKSVREGSEKFLQDKQQDNI